MKHILCCTVLCYPVMWELLGWAEIILPDWSIFLAFPVVRRFVVLFSMVDFDSFDEDVIFSPKTFWWSWRMFFQYWTIKVPRDLVIYEMKNFASSDLEIFRTRRKPATSFEKNMIACMHYWETWQTIEGGSHEICRTCKFTLTNKLLSFKILNFFIKRFCGFMNNIIYLPILSTFWAYFPTVWKIRIFCSFRI